MFRITTQQIGDFSYILGELKNPKPLLNAWASYRRSQFRQQIALQQDPYGESYAPLTAAYREQKQKKWGDRPILRASGKMIRSHTVKVEGNSVRESSESPAQYHQRGNKRLAKRLLLYDDRGLTAPAQDKLLSLAIQRLKR